MGSDAGLVPSLKRSLFLFVLLIILGLAGNYFRYEIFFNIQFFFGSIFALLVLQFLGLRWGVAAAFLISLATYKLWNHPYAIVIMTAEAAVVGLLQRRRNTGLVLADAIYWLFMGIPLVILFYYGVMHQPFYSVGVNMMKQALNGIANALAARLIYLSLAGLMRRERFSLRELLFSFLSAFALFPVLILLAIQSRADYQRIEQSIISELAFASSHAATVLGDSLDDDMNKIVQLARLTGSRVLSDMQHELEIAVTADRDFLRMGLMDRNGVSTAYFPPVDGVGRSAIGKDFSDRPYFPVLRQSLKPMLTDSMTSKLGASQAVVAMVAPVKDRGQFAGFVGAVLNMSRIQTQISNSIALASLPGLQFNLIDDNGRIIISNSVARRPGEFFEPAIGARKEVSGGVYQLVPPHIRNIATLERWKRSYYVAEKPVGTLAEWRLVLEQPFAPFLEELSAKYTRAMALVLLILLASLLLARRLSRGMVLSLDKLKRISTDIPARTSAGSDIAWPESVILETGELIENFRAMTQTLARQFGAIQGMNVGLERRVEERTQELQESLENYRQLFEAESDAILLIENASGRILKANQAACSLYGYDQAELLAMTNIDLSAEVEQTRRVTQETAPAPDTVITIPRRLHRKKDGTVFPVEITGRFFLQGEQPVHIAAIRDITRRTKMEQSLRESEERFRTLFEKVQVVSLIIDPADRSIVDVNTAATVFYGWSREQLLGMKISEINTLSPDDLAGALTAAKSEQRSCFLMRHRLANGSIRDVEVYSGPVNIGGRTLLYSIIHDITERRQAEAEREKFYKFFHTSADLMAIAEPNGTFVKVNPAFTETLGYSETELLARPFIDFVHPEDQQATRDEMARQMQKGHTLNFENRYLCKDGSLRWLEWRAIFDQGEGLTYATARDITEQKQVGDELRRLANEQAVILDSLAIGVVHVKERGLVWSNPAFRRLYGYTLPESVALSVRQLYATDEDYERVGREGYAKISAGEIYRTEVRSVKKDGSPFWLNLSGVAVSPSQPEEGSIWMVEDIDDRKAMEVALVEREKFLRTIIDSEPDCIKLLNADGSLLQMNPAGLAMLDAESLAQVQGQCIYQMIVPEHQEAFKKLTEEVFQGRSGSLQFEAVGLYGRHIWLETHAVPLYSDRDEIIAALGITRDITVRRQEEETLRELTRTLEMRVEDEIGRRLKNEQMLVQQAKLAAMGEMLGAIAHQWRQPLNTLGLCVQNINEAFIHDELDRPFLDRTVRKSMEQIRHMSKTIDDFRNFFQPDKERTVFDTMSAVGEVLSLLSAQLISNEIGFRLTCRTHGKKFKKVADIVSCPDKSVEGFRNEFEHVVLNLISNAQDSIMALRERPGGIAGKGLITFDFYNRDGCLVIEVGDNGTGIPADILPRIFEPYYTTKEQAKGTGIGLYMSRIIIEDHLHGNLVAENRDQGAVFRITLPQPGARTAT